MSGGGKKTLGREEDLGEGRNPFGGFLLSPNLSHPPNFPEPGFIHSAHHVMLYDAEQSTGNGTRECPRLRKVLLSGEAGKQKKIGYRTRLVGGSRFAFWGDG